MVAPGLISIPVRPCAYSDITRGINARYQYMLLTGKLNEHLNQIDQEVREQVEMLMKQMVEKQGVTEELKVQDQMKWVRLMNNIKASAEEIVLKNLICV